MYLITPFSSLPYFRSIPYCDLGSIHLFFTKLHHIVVCIDPQSWEYYFKIHERLLSLDVP
jgi:hypothetical protein